MPQRIVDFAHSLDINLLALNAASVASLFAWASEHMTGIAGGFVMFSVGILNLAKAYDVYKNGSKKNK